MNALPTRSCDYIGPVTDTRVWDSFELRPDDVILSTPPKCGTTWSQAMIMMLLHGRADEDRPVWRDSVWLDCGIGDQAALKEKLDLQTHRRCIKSHTPLDGIPYDPSVTYITVYRHPVDLHFSLEKHVANMVSDRLDFLFPHEKGAAFARFLDAPATQAGTDDLTLASFMHHYRSFHEWAHLPNIHFFHYADLKRDIRHQIARYARAMGLTPDPELQDQIVARSSFASMKDITRRKRQHVPQGAFADETKFFDSATSRKWIGRLSDADIAAYRKRFAQIATQAEIDWLENGAEAKAE